MYVYIYIYIFIYLYINIYIATAFSIMLEIVSFVLLKNKHLSNKKEKLQCTLIENKSPFEN